MSKPTSGLRAVVYARYSSDSQRASSIDDQLRLCRERIAREGWQLVQVYRDAAMSGASALRPGYQALLEGARSAEFDVIVVEALDRLSRDQEDVAGFFKRCKFAGVQIVTLAEGEISELHIGLKGTMNALFLKDLADKTRRGLRGRIEAGSSGGGITYGYNVVSSLDSKGQRKVHEAEAAVVRRIFQAYADGLSPKRIALDLNKEGIAGPRGGLWSPSTINGNRERGTGILNNELYVGRLVWNRLRYSKDPATGRRRSRANDPSSVITSDVPDLRIVEDTLWQAARDRQARLSHRQNATAAVASGASDAGSYWSKQRPKYLFSGLIELLPVRWRLLQDQRGAFRLLNVAQQGRGRMHQRIDRPARPAGDNRPGRSAGPAHGAFDLRIVCGRVHCGVEQAASVRIG